MTNKRVEPPDDRAGPLTTAKDPVTQSMGNLVNLTDQFFAGQEPKSPPPPQPAPGSDGLSASMQLDSMEQLFDGQNLFAARYKKVRLLGKGGFGLVYLVTDINLQRQAALKVLRSDVLNQAKVRERFLREARVAAKWDHPYLCTVYDVGEFQGISYITMAYIEGPNLGERMGADPPLTPEEAATLVAKIARGLAEAHRQQVIHRDLKPANILLKPELEPVITDFGLAFQSDASPLTCHGVIQGTPAYMSPEQTSGNSSAIGPASDIFSLGVVLYELLTSQRPFSGEFTMELLMQIRLEQPLNPREANPTLDEALCELCMKALAKEPKNRFESATAMAEALERWGRRSEDLPPTRKESMVTTAWPTATSAKAEASAQTGRQRYVWPVVGSVVLLASLLLWNQNQLGSQAHNKTQENLSMASAPTAVAQPFLVHATQHTRIATKQPNSLPTAFQADANIIESLKVYLQRANEQTDYRLLSAEQLPVLEDDKVSLLVNLNEEAFVYLYWFDRQGKPIRLLPDPKTQQAEGKARQHWSPPKASQGDLQLWHLQGGDSGTELLLVGARSTPLDAKELAWLDRTRVILADLPISTTPRDPDQILTAALNEPQRGVLDPSAVLFVKDAGSTLIQAVTPRKTQAAHEQVRAPVAIVQTKGGKEITSQKPADYEAKLRQLFPNAYHGVVVQFQGKQPTSRK